MTKEQILLALPKLSEQDLREVYENTLDILKHQQTMRQFEATKAFKINDKVFFDSKRGMRVEGTISKINVKSIKVVTANGIWNVSPSMLQKVS